MNIVKLGWGTRIAILYCGFVVLIIVLVAGSMRQSFDLVTPDYYSQELKYQDVIDAGKNQTALSAPLQISTGERSITINFPSEFLSKSINGTVQFYSPVNSAWDKQLDIAVVNNVMNVQKSILRPTRYIVKVSWQADSKKYYQESELNISK
jgi:nitrogen fixation protein FixH